MAFCVLHSYMKKPTIKKGCVPHQMSLHKHVIAGLNDQTQVAKESTTHHVHVLYNILNTHTTSSHIHIHIHSLKGNPSTLCCTEYIHSVLLSDGECSTHHCLLSFLLTLCCNDSQVTLQLPLRAEYTNGRMIHPDQSCLNHKEAMQPLTHAEPYHTPHYHCAYQRVYVHVHIKSKNTCQNGNTIF